MDSYDDIEIASNYRQPDRLSFLNFKLFLIYVFFFIFCVEVVDGIAVDGVAILT